MTKTFTLRVLSALAAVAVLSASYYFFQDFGVKILTDVIVLIALLELMEILFPKPAPLLPKVLCFVFTALIFHLSASYPSLALNGIAVLAVLFLVLSLLLQGFFKELQDLTGFQSKSLLSFIYMGLFPSFAVRLLDLPSGSYWFLTLLAVVFIGDIGAYAAGVLVGRHKINPRLSPKKTWEGAVGGLCGSLLAASICSYLLPAVPLMTLLVTAACAGFVAQFGDFFESLLKRVADVKDSGKIMPGHGGFLDRVDGVIFASPVFFLVGALVESHF